MIHTIDLKFLNTPRVIAAYLVETSAGPVLIETGPHSTFKHLKAGIEQLGYGISEIKHVFLTHIHFDHAGAAWAFAELGAQVYLHPIGYPHMKDPTRLVESAKRIYKDKMDELWGQLRPIAKNQMQQVEDNQSFAIGDTLLKAHHTPGHAIHHIAWEVNGHLFAGDVAGIAIENGVVFPPCPPPDIHIEDWQNSLNRIRQLNIEKLYLAHFGEVGDIEAHLDKLETRLLDWAQWMKPFAEQQTQTEVIIPQFESYVAEQLRKEGISENGIKQYEAANPAWMSVAGLMRYWKIKFRDS
jgi:glyoxylase-like metal-dependent hydrolase (beta-lactamase superfamily II)